MKKCNSCERTYPKKDFYNLAPYNGKKNTSNVCKFCTRVYRVNKYRFIGGFKLNNTNILELIDIENKRIGDIKSRKLKPKIKSRLRNVFFKCHICKGYYKKNHLIKKQDRCESCNKDYQNKWRKNNISHYNKYRREYIKKKKEKDDFYRFICNVRILIGASIRNQGYTKKSKTQEILGCDWNTFKLHLERQFTKGMSWENRSEWHIDHIYPISKAKSEEEAVKLNHYTNLRPMWAKDNLLKNAKIIEHQMKLPL